MACTCVRVAFCGTEQWIGKGEGKREKGMKKEEGERERERKRVSEEEGGYVCVTVCTFCLCISTNLYEFSR